MVKPKAPATTDDVDAADDQDLESEKEPGDAGADEAGEDLPGGAEETPDATDPVETPKDKAGKASKNATGAEGDELLAAEDLPQAGITPLSVPGGSYCTVPGVYALDDSLQALTNWTSEVRSLALAGSGTTASVGTGPWQSGAIGIRPDGSSAWMVTRYSDNPTTSTQVQIHRMNASADTSTQVYYSATGPANLGQPTAGVVGKVGGKDYFYFASYSRSGNPATTRLELFAYNITDSAWVGQVGRITLSGTNSAGTGDIAFDAQGRMVILWSGAAGTNSRLYQLATVPTTASTSDNTSATLLTDAITTTDTVWNGLAYDSTGNLWISTRNLITRNSTLARVNPSTGALSNSTAISGFPITDLASCGTTATTLRLQKNLTNARYNAADQFTLDIRQSGNNANLAQATTTGTATGTQAATAGPAAISTGAQYTIAETGASGANLANYTKTYACSWADGTSFVSAGTALPYDADTGRAQATLPSIPTNRAGQALSCTISNTSNTVSMTLRKNVVSRFTDTDQFKLDIRPQGSADNVRETTTTSTGNGIQTPATEALTVAPNAVLAIAETAVGNASLANYTMTYGCTWSGGGSLVAAGTALPYDANSGRAQATLPAIPSDKAGQELTCTIANTAKDPALVPPRLVLQKNLTNRKNTNDQFTLSIARATEATPLATATTSGTATGLQGQKTAPVTIESGIAYSISETGANGANLNEYTSSYVCRWGDWATGEEFTRGSLSVSENRKQAILPATPSGRNGQTLTCTILNQPVPANGLECAAGRFYGASHSQALSPNNGGSNGIKLITRSPSGALSASTTPRITTTYDTANNPPNVSNALGINQDGTVAYTVFEPALASAWPKTAVNIQKWTAGTSAMVNTNATADGTVSVPSNVAGAVDPTTGIYYFGGYTQAAPPVLRLFAYDPVANKYWHALNVNVPEGRNSNGNGDLAFDASGNLYLVWSPGTAPNNQTVLARVNAGSVPTSKPTSVSTVTADFIRNLDGPANGAFNGITFDADGRLYVSNTASNSGVQELNPATGEFVGTPIGANTFNFTDLAACGSPPTMRLEKNIIERHTAGNQFRLHIDAVNGATITQNASASADTTGTNTGVQPQIVGPMVVTVGQQYRIRETAIGSPATTFANYMTGFECRWSGSNELWESGWLTGAGTTERSYTLPAIPSGRSGQQLVCTITNAPIFPATITAKKTVQDARGQNATGAAGWDISAVRVNTSASTTDTTITTPATKTTAAGGAVTTPWRVDFPNSSAVMATTISETMQDGFAFVSGSCTIRPRFGPVRTVPITGTSITLTGSGNPNRAIQPGDRIECEFVNREQPGSAAWQKVDEASTSTRLSGSEWELTGPGVPEDTVVTDCVAASAAACPAGDYRDRDHRAGYFRIDNLIHGGYEITEVKAPVGFVLDSTVHEFVIGSGSIDHVFSTPFVNRRTQVPAIPLTGGLSGDAYVLGGLALLALGGLAVLALRRRRPGEAQT